MARAVKRTQSQDQRHDIVLRLLDHQIVGPDDQMLGNVDDLVLVRTKEQWLVTGIMVGPPALANRLPGKLGTWTGAIWRRLRPDPDPAPLVIPMSDVTRIGSAVTVNESAAQRLADAFGLELWLRTFVISRIPGAKGGGEDDQPHADARRPKSATSRTGTPKDTSSVSDVVGARVLSQSGAVLGTVTDLRCTGRPRAQPQESLRVTHVQYGPHTVGSELGYTDDRTQGPLPLGALIRWWQRGERLAPLADVVAVDPQAGTVTIARETGHVHPHHT